MLSEVSTSDLQPLVQFENGKSKMQFEKSALIFVTGFVLFVIGGFLNAIGISGSITYSLTQSISDSGINDGYVGTRGIDTPGVYASSGNDGYVALAVFGSVLALIGLIQMCIGAYRALKKIDALPVPVPIPVPVPVPAERVGTPAFPVELAEPALAPAQPQSYSPPQTPKHLIYNESYSEEQPPVE